ncbi:MAG: potassium/proton antiporter [Bacteroidaceae bacterium]|nr:potassium/proton antiporter [Bacteroidaceae bacterium]MBQ2979998.1 potassium/proton antiporter [Bacteroidaceae bacterium]
MIITTGNILLVGSLLLLVSIILSKAGYRFGVPTLLVFLIAGMLFGSDGLGLQFNDASEAQFIGVIALGIILFSGGMDTRFSDIKPVLAPGIVLSTLGVVLTTLFAGVFIYWLSGFGWINITLPLTTSLLLAATMSSTDSASVFNILRSQRMSLKHNLRPMLELESGSNDPMAYMLTLVLIQVVGAGGVTAGDVVSMLLVQFVIGGAAGYLLGRAAVWFVNKLALPNTSLYPIVMLGLVFLIYSVADVCHGNGFLAVYIAGIVVGNSRISFKREVSTFLDGVTWLLQIVLFLILGLLVNPHEMMGIALAGTLIGVFMILVARPLGVMICLLPFKHINFKSRLFVSWVGLRGAAPILFATYPIIAGVEGANIIFNVVFFVTIVSLVVQGTTLSSMANLLGVSEPEPETPDHFGIELPEELETSLNALDVTAEMLVDGVTLKEVKLPGGALVMLIRRGQEFIVPNGSVQLQVGDRLLLISQEVKPREKLKI